jgi:hypothetical protein
LRWVDDGGWLVVQEEQGMKLSLRDESKSGSAPDDTCASPNDGE